ncbi:hypothetical protein MPH_06920 [Macrophomina phaseolina MS6]|uniref:Autophagy-related protein 1 n=1 Tax=Macrophomina phaseolina (strain MS6) TaxID=1126212 RepID=K2S0E1_MACPH|nr:hypothetical protein MPH_06920 [Macrophomina phaseolina MS6]
MKPRKIGEGGYGAVHVAVHRKTQRQHACKIVALDTIRQQKDISEERLTREFDILRDLDHPNIVRLEKVFHSHTNLYIFQELLSGGDLFSFMDRSHRSGIRSIEAAVIVQQILRGIDYLHDRGIVHRDLKPDNILLTSAKIGSRVVITDFGQARHLPSPKQPSKIVSKRMNTVVGTIGFNAPDWEPKRKVFKLVERIESSRPKMDLHASRFFGEPLPPDRGSLPILLVSGLSSKLPAIEEESDCPPASPFEPQQTTEDDESEIPLPAQSHKITETEEFTPAQDRSPTHQSPSVLNHAQLINPKQRAHEDSSSTQDLDSPHQEVPDLSLGHMLAQLSNARQGFHMFCENSMPLSSTSADSYTFGPPNTGPESVSQEMTRLSLLEERNDVAMTKTNAVVEPSDDEVQETAETTSSGQRANHVTLGKRQPSFDFDEGMDDIDFLEVAAAVDFRQVVWKRPRIS